MLAVVAFIIALAVTWATKQATAPVASPREEEPAVLAPTATPERLWVPAGRSVEVRGFAIPGGLLYVGTGLGSVNQRLGRPEPALINPSLAVALDRADVTGERMDYWPSYAAIAPSCRTAYLRWLAGGRQDPGVYIGYVFLFFYGLERRLLFDAPRSAAAQAEMPVIAAEVERLLGIYGGNASFRGYASAFLGLAPLLKGAIDPDALKPATERAGWEVPLSTKLALGAFAKEGKPIPGEWAFSWLVTTPTVSLRTPAQRCRGEFRELFLLRYRELYGNGLKLPAIKTRLELTYQPASPSFGGTVTMSAPDLPDATRSTSTLEKLASLAEKVTGELEAYSRFVGRTGEAQSPAALALLPPELATTRGSAEAEALCRWLEEQLAGGAEVLIEAAALLEQWPRPAGESLTRRDLQHLSSFLASRGTGIEPDVAAGGMPLTRTKRAVLFRLPPGGASALSPAYAGAALLLHLAAVVAAADGTVSTEEEQHLTAHLARGLHLSAAERVRLRAHLSWLVAEPPSLSGLKKRLGALSPDEGSSLGTFLISLAAADGHFGAEELKVLTRVYGLLGLEPQSIYSDVHQLMSGAEPAAEEPVTVRPAAPGGAPFRIPRPAGEAAGTIELDRAKVEAKLAETERVSELLAGIFVEEPTETTPRVPAPPPANERSVAGLDGPHSALLLRLASAGSWERAAVERLAAELSLLPEGALEVINEAAFARAGAPLFEGDEVIEIDPQVLEELLS